MTAAAALARPREAARTQGPGAALRAAREQRALGVAAVTEALHVEARLIEAMEADHFAAFDAPVYARGFLRNYASFLELPVEELLAGYEALSGCPATPTLIPAAHAPPPSRDWSRFKRPAALLVAAGLAGGLWWWRLAHAPSPRLPATGVAAAAASDVGPAAPADVPARGVSPRAAATRGADPLVVTAGQECWVEVYSPTGARLLYDLLRPGERRSLPGPGPWRVFLGYADGVRLSVRERTVGVPASRRAAATARLVVAGDGAVN
jgi:cytoskeleton protein RodZ